MTSCGDINIFRNKTWPHVPSVQLLRLGTDYAEPRVRSTVWADEFVTGVIVTRLFFVAKAHLTCSERELLGNRFVFYSCTGILVPAPGPTSASVSAGSGCDLRVLSGRILVDLVAGAMGPTCS